jgi:hypothetical protein
MSKRTRTAECKDSFDVLALVEQVKEAVVYVCGVHYPAEKFKIIADISSDNKTVLKVSVMGTNYKQAITAHGLHTINDVFARHKLAEHSATCYYAMWDLRILEEQKRGGVVADMDLPLAQVCDSLEWIDTHREKRLARWDDAIDTLNCIRVACGYERISVDD